MIKMYNDRFTFMYDLIKDFLVLHYQGGRTDSEFWKYITAGNTLTDHVKNIIEISKYRLPNNSLFPGISGASGWPLWSYIMAGTNNLDPNISRKELELHRITKFAQATYEQRVVQQLSAIDSLPDNTEEIRKRQRVSAI